MNSASAFCWAIAPASVAGLIAPASVNGVATTGWPCFAISIRPSDIGPSRRSGAVRVDDRHEARLVLERVVVDAPGEGRDLERVVDDGRPEPEALPRLVEQRRERPVHVEVAGRDRQVGRLERAAALLVDDVEGADDADVVEEVGVVAGPPATVDVGDEGGPADGREDDVAVTERQALRRVAGVEPERRRGLRDELLDVGRVEPDAARLAVDRRAGRRPAGRSPGRRGARRRSRTGSGATRGGASRPRRRRGSRPGGRGSGRSATAAGESRPTSDAVDAGRPRSSWAHDTPAHGRPMTEFPARAGRRMRASGWSRARNARCGREARPTSRR